MQDLVYLNEAYKLAAICDEIERCMRRTTDLIGTVSIEKSEQLSAMLKRRGIRHEVLNAKNHAREAAIIENAGAKGAVTIATNMAGRGTDIKLGGSLDAMVRTKCGSEATLSAYDQAKQAVYPQWKSAYEEVKTLGGLYILGTERHESRRIDNQLRGRSGRQGDPGTSRFFLSLDDTLMRLFAKDSIRSMLGKIGMGAEPIEHSIVSRAIEKAQMRVEEQNFEIRKHLLEYDDVLNEQRNFLYAQRDDILQAENLVERGLDAIREITADIVRTIESEGNHTDKIIERLREETEARFHFPIQPDASAMEGLDKEGLAELLFLRIKTHIEEKIALTGMKPFNDFLRLQYLRQIDMRWQDHLDQLEALREAVYLRTYAQKNPLLEYKLEGFDIFDSMIAQIRSYIATLMVRVRITTTDQSAHARRAEPARVVESHGGINQFAGSSAPPRMQGALPGQAAVQIRRTTAKVGRNEPCPCGSGKKYKHCHGKDA